MLVPWKSLKVDGTGYELAERMPGDPVEQITAAHVPQLVALVGRDRGVVVDRDG
jgi:hypothetical protein